MLVVTDKLNVNVPVASIEFFNTDDIRFANTTAAVVLMSTVGFVELEEVMDELVRSFAELFRHDK